jgi:hypothetical protein
MSSTYACASKQLQEKYTKLILGLLHGWRCTELMNRYYFMVIILSEQYRLSLAVGWLIVRIKLQLLGGPATLEL